MTTATPRLEDLVALNQEIAALARAGIPLEIGLRQHTESWPTQFSALADRMAARLDRGESLSAALRQEGPVISPAYAAVVEAGLQSGRLPEALENLAEQGLLVQEVRRRVGLSLVYPLIVCSLAYVMFVLFIAFGVPLWTSTREAFFLPPRFFFTLLNQLHQTVHLWGPLIPLVLIIGIISRNWFDTSALSGSWRQIGLYLWIPGIAAFHRLVLRAQFARLLSLLIEHQLPAGRAVLLAAESTGDVRLSASAGVIADELQRGATWGEAVTAATGLPRYLQWMMVVGERQGALSVVLQQTADTYQRKADRWLSWIRSVLPLVLVAVISGGVVLMYALFLLLPLQQFWFDLMEYNP